MVTSQYQGVQGPTAGIMSNGVIPEGLDLNSIIGSIIQALPGQIIGILSAHPQVQQLARGGVTPQSLFNVGVNTPFGGAGLGVFDSRPQLGAQYAAGVAPQGFDFGQIISTVAQTAAQHLPGLLMSLLSAHPQFQQLARQTGGVNPQSLFNVGINTPIGSAGIGLFDNKPQLAGQYGAGVAPQGIDFGQIFSTVAQGAVQVLPGLLMSLLSAHPQIQQLARQTGGVNPQSLFNVGINTPIGSAGIGLFDNKPQFAGQYGAGVAPQGFDFGQIINTVAQSAAQALPGLLMSLLSAHPQVPQLTAQGIDLGTIARNVAQILVPQIPAIASGVMNQLLGARTTMH